jgi:hypothetical protein
MLLFTLIVVGIFWEASLQARSLLTHAPQKWTK